MRMSTGTRLLPLLAALVGLLALPSAAGALTIGIADNKADMFTDTRFEQSGVQHARISIGWDALDSPWQVAELDHWMEKARAANVTPLVSFGHSRTDRRSLPGPQRFLLEFRRFRARYPWVREFATWNEANHCGEPTCHRPALVAAYYKKLRRECRECRILAAEVLDMPNMVRWVRNFKRATHSEPRYWGLHNYIDANRRRTTGTRRMLGAVNGQVWFTETGGIVWRKNRGKVPFPESAGHAARATRFLFERLVPLSRRVTRVYIYHWNVDGNAGTWDSALFDPAGNARPAYRVVARVLHRQQVKRAARLARSGGTGAS
jgi:polysaccharide biosynthesis protein PslG